MSDFDPLEFLQSEMEEVGSQDAASAASSPLQPMGLPADGPFGGAIRPAQIETTAGPVSYPEVQMPWSRQSTAGAAFSPGVVRPPAVLNVQSGVGPSQSQLVTQTLSGLVSNMEMLTAAQEDAHSAVGSSQKMSSAAMRMVAAEKKEREREKRKMEEKIHSLESSLQDQLKVSREAVAAVSRLQHMAERQQSHFQAGPSSSPFPSPVLGQDTAAQLSARIQEAEARLRAGQSQSSVPMPLSVPMPSCSWPGLVFPSALSLPGNFTSQWPFTSPLPVSAPMGNSQSPFSVQIKPREPQPFSGERGQDVVSWLRTVDDYFRLVHCTEEQQIAYLILALTGNARVWWDAEMQARGDHVPNTVAEFRMLLRAQFESPMREHKARAELCKLAQRKGENASAYMARTKALLHKVPGYDMRTALHQWVVGLRAPYRLEVAKTGPKDMHEAEKLVSRLEEAFEFDKTSKNVEQAGKDASKGGNDGKGNQNKKKKFFGDNQGGGKQGGDQKTGFYGQKRQGQGNSGNNRRNYQQSGQDHRLKPHVPPNQMLPFSTRVTEVVGLVSVDVEGMAEDDPRWLA